ncbi:MAG: fructose-1,6-bisphosphatase [Bacteroidaceae bacterium]|nr:fructose-1,6-bisphosphatase [Bacteroidaceae bacterium]
MNKNLINSMDSKVLGADMRLLELLSQTFPNSSSASTEIINLEAIMNLPKGTEHFVADIHGEHEAFLHILRNASGNIKRKVKELFGESLSDKEIRELCTLIYYPEKKLEMIKEKADEDLSQYYAVSLYRLIQVCQSVSSKYTRSKVRKVLPRQFAYIIEELLHESPIDDDKEAYFQRIIETIIQTGQAQNFITVICNVIQKLSIDQLHILGDIFDRGPGAHIIMDYLLTRENFDIQWGNHDALWMGAAAGCDPCIATVLRLSLRFGNMTTLEEGYGINLLPLATFAIEYYSEDPCKEFIPHTEKPLDEKSTRLIAQMHKAISIIQFKLEAQMRRQYPEWGINGPGTLENIDYNRSVYILDGKEYELKDRIFPTVNPSDPYKLTPEEEDVVNKLHHSFRISEKLQKHIRCLLSHGCMYGIFNGNLLFHASIPLNEDGSLKEVMLNGKKYKGKELLHHIGMYIRTAFQNDVSKTERQKARDYFWYLWCGPDSPLFDKNRMTTFERYFLADNSLYHEEKGNYYKLREKPEICDSILDAFDVKGSNRHIINGHVPVHASQGENPIKADGRLMVIDGGFAKAYHKTTGIAGYTLVYHSRGFLLIQHEPFTSTREAIMNETDIKSSTQIEVMTGKRVRVRDTDKGVILKRQVKELRELLYAYQHGIIKEK